MPPALDTELIELAAGELRVTLAPQVGGSIASFCRIFSQGDRQRCMSWLRSASAQAMADCDPLGMASFPLVPFCNRIRNGRATFEGRDIRFPPNHPASDSPHPLHGIGWQRPWRVVRAGHAEAELALEVDATSAWPWRFSARQQFSLQDDRLSVVMSLTNADTATMPAGIGHHPYFPHEPGTRLTARTQAMWRGDGEVMPVAIEEGEVVNKLRAGVVLSELDLDNNFVGWEHEARVDWPADAQGPRRSLVMQAEAPLDYFVVYCPRNHDHFCAEPVSQCTDWLNLLPKYSAAAVGGARLLPGETLRAVFTMTPYWD